MCDCHNSEACVVMCRTTSDGVCVLGWCDGDITLGGGFRLPGGIGATREVEVCDRVLARVWRYTSGELPALIRQIRTEVREEWMGS